MKKISTEKHKEIMLEMLSEFNKFCQENDIKYSLIGGSLIGAIRHGGIIPWDDDIDIILMPEEYDKLFEKLNNNNFKYRVVGYFNTNDYYNTHIKIVDDSTIVFEGGLERNYGVFLDIFRFNYIPDNILKKTIYLFKYRFMFTIIHGFSPFAKNSKNIIKKMRNLYSKKQNKIKYIEKFDSYTKKNNNLKTKKVICNSIMSSLSTAIQETKNLQQYSTIKFDGIDAMIFKNYDVILTNSFGDYMTPPPEEQRIKKHDVNVYMK